ncbi:MAG: GGDEF domain-containing protein [Holophagales bacterium]|jgi:diguanylate cyclase (GGDEF)-like protein|nr:GGDEF domain-containing protein [Holophagales bacterium]
MNSFQRVIAKIMHGYQIPQGMAESCREELYKINQARFGRLAPLALAALTVILAAFFVNAFMAGFEGPVLAHIIANSAYLVFLTCCFFLWKKQWFVDEKLFKFFVYTIVFISLFWTGVLSVLEQNIACYAMGILLFSAVFTLNPRIFLCLQLSILLSLLATIPFLNINHFTILSNYINISFCTFLSVYIAHLAFCSTLENIIKKITIEQQNLELKELVVKLKDLSETDSLTLLYNRRKFNSIMREEWRKAVRSAASLVLIIVDVDFFKKYNDTYGHLKGDDCLVQISQALKSNFLRANEFLARYGGEEFAIIMANSGINEGVSACRRVIEAINALNIPHRQSLVSDFVTVSAGLMADIPKAVDSLEDFINCADQALYDAKKTGRNRYVVADKAWNAIIER